MLFKINICTWNANGVSNKIEHLKNYIRNRKIDMLLNERKLKVGKNKNTRLQTSMEKS